MYLVKVYVTYKDSILDPKGEAVNDALHRLGYENVQSVELGKYFELKLAAGERPVATEVDEMCDQLLANVNMETYRYEITEMEAL
ncbi:phosphoribosylformylglycinamidine synthase subunit PurS [Lactiplantibacillus mudanjiangensis]|uniref:Phosphoribosylformylglycinamidine synthase subunit PurS n=1 Tax=Lactiplantibacillus mudanjiangensis TaxID=1296538 RepID=A0A660DX28_9LACO|nr:phosphoribosylformylglycinamidine synthase subunit PurS [Lactiplantibacillus mudanjiangensis]VDG18867.1 phosphoribosylformylglycinamidine synthase [Lactobacillus sp.] [Lactiplantibacillus mudanjiangensis]VDG25354.1 phosphoribosylformylglycinamidine synthase [Lactobacillus sp.] [Lactiplantibacillus mudanjiangensis]VDG27618.1 phosphoribosylformylglycinamidine synthase [Lactobacillus sp.] [Lactiplantibacillus mudanjiangensis]VDG32966.1 phosphoribosylformylglycinamidine synthase [Lactobacillus s